MKVVSGGERVRVVKLFELELSRAEVFGIYSGALAEWNLAIDSCHECLCAVMERRHPGPFKHGGRAMGPIKPLS